MEKRSDRVKLKYCRTNQMSEDINVTIGKNRNRRHRDLIESLSDQEKLRGDWYNVGQDINKAIKVYDLNYSTRDNEKYR